MERNKTQKIVTMETPRSQLMEKDVLIAFKKPIGHAQEAQRTLLKLALQHAET
jgi:hypothetical protein